MRNEAAVTGKPVAEQSAEPKAAWQERVLQVVRRPDFLAGLVAVLAISFLFQGLFKLLPSLWLDFDSYYSHGLLIPFAAAYIGWLRWPKLREIPVKGSSWALIALLPILYVTAIAARTEMPFVMSVMFIGALLSSVWFVAGWRWMIGLAPAILFLLLGLPVLDRFIDTITFKLQLISTDTAEAMFKLAGLNTWRQDATAIYLDNYSLEVAEACSGLKTTIAVGATVVFFMLVSKLKWWGNSILTLSAIPLSILVNGLRITMIGLVGNSKGAEAAAEFHDFSGYIALIVCFIVLAKLTKVLEGKKKENTAE